MNHATTAMGKDIPITLRVWDGLSRLLLWAAAALVLVALVRLVWQGVHAPVTHVVISGDTMHQSEHGLRPYLSEPLKVDFWRLPLSSVAASIDEAPWVRQATVQRDYPAGLRVHIQEHQAAAWWAEAMGNRLVNSYGEIFEAPVSDEDKATQHWPVLNGPAERSAEILRAYVQLSQALANTDLQVQSLRLSAHGTWQAVLNADIQLALGRSAPETWHDKLAPMLSTLPALRSSYDQALRSIDLRYPNGFAVSLSGVSVGPKL